MKQLEVQIMGQSYLLGCPEGGEARLQDAVQRVDAAMCKIRDAGKVRARDRIAVLAALNLAFDLADKPANLPPTDSPVHRPSAAQAKAPALSASNAPEPQLTALLARLDDALHEDGQLL